MTLGELCEATLTTSDNTAANLILAQQGGPAGLTAFVRKLGDKVTRLDRNEPTLNHWQRGELRDTTSPRAMLHSLHLLVLGGTLKPASREQLLRWLVANTTGDARLRAGLPGAWRVGDKTGTGDGITNDVAVAWPPGHAPLLVTAYLSEARASDEACDAALAQVGRLLTQIVPPGPRQGDQAG
jgi:beta-lactamase class A